MATKLSDFYLVMIILEFTFYGYHSLRGELEFFRNIPQYKNANIGNFVLTVPLEINWTNDVYNLAIKYFCTQ